MSDIFQQIKAHLRHNQHQLSMLFPQAKLKGNELYFDSPSYNSWSYNLQKGIAQDFRTGESQDVITVYQKLNGIVSSIECARQMAGKLNLSVNEINKENVVGKGNHERCPTTEGTISKPKVESNPNITNIINTIWSDSLPLGGTVAETYLRKRGITLPFSRTQRGNSLRFHPNLHHRETDQKHPTLIAGVYDCQNKLTAIHRHYLTADGEKLDVKHNKMLLGKVSGHAIKLSPIKQGEPLLICEGVESGLSLLQKTKLPVWCAISAHNIKNLILPAKNAVREICIYPDIEPSQTGMRNAYTAQSKWQAQGYVVHVILPTLTLHDGSVVDLNAPDAREQLKAKREYLPFAKMGRSIDDYLFEERAAIIQYDGCLPKVEAEKLAKEELSSRNI